MSYRMACDHADVAAAIVGLEAATWNDPAGARRARASQCSRSTARRPAITYGGGVFRKPDYPGAKQTLATWARTTDAGSPPTAGTGVTIGGGPAVRHRDRVPRGLPGNGHAELWTQPHGVHSRSSHPTSPTR